MKSSFYKHLLAGAFLLTSSLASANTALPGDDWLHVEGNQILDMNDNPVWLTGANWFGFNAGERVLHGLWSVNLNETLADIASRGINILRIPISTQVALEWRDGIDNSTYDDWANKDLASSTSLGVFEGLLAGSRKYGLKILLDMHGAEADNMGHIYPMWYKGDITTEDFYDAWLWIAERYKNDDTIIAYDLQNEPHGKPWADDVWAKWDDSTDANNWKFVCEDLSNKILDIHPNILIMCEGVESYPKDGKTWTGGEDAYHNIWWGGNLRGVADYPIDLGDRQKQLMYSPHDYGPKVFEQPWFYEGFNKQTLYDDIWKENWMFIHEDNISPLLIGEWGGFMDGGDNEKWMLAIRELILEYGLHHTFWCINPNSGDTGGLLDHSWKQWDEEKYALFEPTLWRNQNKKFIGLDHTVPLGSSATGISLNEHFGISQSPTVVITQPNANSDIEVNSSFVINYSLIQATQVNAYINSTKVGTGAMTGTINLTAPANTGEFTVVLKAVDKDGVELNVSDSITLNAIAELPPEPAISLLKPSAADDIKTGDEFEVKVSLQDAAGFAWQFDNISGQTKGTVKTLTAPAVADTYTLKVTALDEYDQTLAVSDTLYVKVSSADEKSTLCSIYGGDAQASANTSIKGALLMHFVRPICNLK